MSDPPFSVRKGRNMGIKENIDYDMQGTYFHCANTSNKQLNPKRNEALASDKLFAKTIVKVVALLAAATISIALKNSAHMLWALLGFLDYDR